MLLFIERGRKFKMRMKTIGIVVFLVITTVTVYGQETEFDIMKDTLIGIKFGYLGAGTIYVEGIAGDTDSSSTFGTFLDYRVAEKLYMNFYLDMHTITAYGISKTLTDIGGGFKVVFYNEESGIVFRPSICLGYGSLPGISLGNYYVDSSSYFIIKPSLEILIPTKSNLAVLGEIGFISAPVGGNSDFDVTMEPTLILRAGIIF